MSFELGRVVVTTNCVRRLTIDGEAAVLVEMRDIAPLLHRHASGDWGDIATDDVGLNEQALEDGSRLLSVYEVRGVKVWIITDAASDACAACWTGVGRCEPEKGTWHGDIHFRDDLPPRRLSTTCSCPRTTRCGSRRVDTPSRG